MTAPALSREEELYWLALKLVPGLGARTSGKLLERFRTPKTIFRASRTELEAAGVSGAVAQSIASGCTFEDAATQHDKMAEAGAIAIPMGDARYPARLHDIFDPPILLFARGRVELLDSLMIGVVGTRRPTPYGVAVAERLSADLAHAGLTIVSGMARGIDSSAHKGALAAAGDTVAVLGCGVDVVYPSENRKLAAEIAAKGLIISEFPMGTVAFPQNFPIRNRVITFLVGGGCDVRTERVELIVNGQVVLQATGKCTETMERVLWDVSPYVGQTAQIRLVDAFGGGWGHINFDDVKFE